VRAIDCGEIGQNIRVAERWCKVLDVWKNQAVVFIVDRLIEIDFGLEEFMNVRDIGNRFRIRRCHGESNGVQFLSVEKLNLAIVLWSLVTARTIEQLENSSTERSLLETKNMEGGYTCKCSSKAVGSATESGAAGLAVSLMSRMPQ
jgi:hypothetical protein